MYFNIFYGNLVELVAEDYLELIRRLVTAAGFSARYEKTSLIPNSVNIILDNFFDETENAILELRRQGGEVIVVGTEFITGDTFNQFDSQQQSSFYSSKQDYWRKRFENFVRCARHARAVWLSTSHPEMVASYRHVLGNVPIVTIPPCFFPDAPRPQPVPQDLDFFFSGTYTDHRVAILQSLANEFNVRFQESNVPDFIRRHLSLRAKACLNLRINDAWPYPSQLRSWYHLHYGSLVIREATPAVFELDAYTVTFPREDLLQGCRELLKSGDWMSRGKELHEKFCADWHVQKHVQEFFEKTFAT